MTKVLYAPGGDSSPGLKTWGFLAVSINKANYHDAPPKNTISE
jgi:hypothetical protein